MKALAEHVPVTHDHGADERVRAGVTPAALGELDRSREMLVVGGL
jgi:hypothetical protein